MLSRRFELNRADWKRWGKNALIFLGPTLIVLFTSISEQIPKDWAFGAVLLYLLNLALDLLRKFLAGR